MTENESGGCYLKCGENLNQVVGEEKGLKRQDDWIGLIWEWKRRTRRAIQNIPGFWLGNR